MPFAARRCAHAFSRPGISRCHVLCRRSKGKGAGGRDRGARETVGRSPCCGRGFRGRSTGGLRHYKTSNMRSSDEANKGRCQPVRRGRRRTLDGTGDPCSNQRLRCPDVPKISGLETGCSHNQPPGVIPSSPRGCAFPRRATRRHLRLARAPCRRATGAAGTAAASIPPPSDARLAADQLAIGCAASRRRSLRSPSPALPGAGIRLHGILYCRV